MTAKAFLLIASIAMLSCATSGNTAAGKLVGDWRGSIGGRTAEYRFHPDGTFRGSVTAGRSIVANFTGRWSLQGATIQYQYLGDTTGNIPPGTRDQDTLVTIGKDEYVIQAADGSHRKYVRIGNEAPAELQKHRGG